MNDTPAEMAQRLTEYVNDLVDARSMKNKRAVRGRTQMILTVLDKLRNAHKATPLSKELISRIQKDKKRAKISLPPTSSEYLNICWKCYKKRKKKVILDKRVDSVCKECGWVRCPECGACADPKYKSCKEQGDENQKSVHRGC